MLGKGRLYVLAAAGVLVLGIGSYAVAGNLNGPPNVPDKKHFDTELNSYLEVPSVSSTGYGDFEAKLVEPEKIEFTFRYAGLEGGDSRFAHIHFAQRSVNGGVVVFLCGGGTKPTPCPNGSGEVTGTLTPADIGSGASAQGIGTVPAVVGPPPVAAIPDPTAWAEFVRALRAGHTYVNIHTVRWGGGEIRGQINNEDQKELE